MGKSVNKNKKSSIFSKRNIAFAVVVLIITTPLVTYGINRWMDNIDRERFTAVKGAVEKIADRLSTNLSEIEWIVESTCRRGNLPFGEGDASCDSRVTGTLPAVSLDNIQSVAARFNDTLAESSDLIEERKAEQKDPETFLADLELGYSGAGFNDRSTGMRCSSLQQIVKDSLDSKVFRLVFECSDHSRDTWFPRSDL